MNKINDQDIRVVESIFLNFVPFLSEFHNISTML